MNRKAKFLLTFAAAATIVVVLVLSSFGGMLGKDSLYSVTAEQWQAAFGDEAYIQKIYNNVTIEISGGRDNDYMILAAANRGLMLDNKAADKKLICVPTEDGFTSYVWNYSTEIWEIHDGKAEGVDACLYTYLPGYVDIAMEGLKGAFEKASFDYKEKCYIITVEKQEKPANGETVGTKTMHCRVFFENGMLVRLETEIISATTLIMRLYNIGVTQVTAPIIEEEIPQ